MVLLSYIVIVASVLLYRALVLTIPFFEVEVSRYPLVNVFCGLASDMAFLGALGICFLPFLGRGERRRPVASTISLALAALVTATFATHLRYVEHFGLNLRPFHLGTLEGGQMWTVGVHMVLQSWRAVLLLVLSWAGVLLLKGRVARLRLWLARPMRRVSAALVLLILAAGGNSASIHLRHAEGIHNTLRYNPVLAAHYTIEDEGFGESRYPFPEVSARSMVRAFTGGQRAWAAEGDNAEFPFWQKSLPKGGGNGPEVEALRAALVDFLEKGRQEHGPWNVVFVTMEGLRAAELAAFDTEQYKGMGLGKEFLAMAAQGLRFTEVIGAGMRTAFGQAAGQCSQYGVEDFTLLSAPTSYSVCLGDVFKAKDYRTYFFYGADNHFDNQDVFYRFHGFDVVHDENQIAGGAKGGWGYSDLVLFDHALEVLEEAPKPFYAHVLTLSNHAPWVLPPDAPREIAESGLEMPWKLVPYVDHAIGHFYRELVRKHPHTLVVLVADHGRYEGDRFSKKPPPYREVRKVARIPLLLIAPGMPKELAGKAVTHLVSQTDIPPTLLSLFGWDDIDHQFMGTDAFSRTEPVYIDLMQSLVEISPDFDVRKVEPAKQGLLGAISRYNLLAPPRDTWKIAPRTSLEH